MIRTLKDLGVYELSYQMAMEIFLMTKNFPKDEVYSLTGQIRRASRSVPANIAEGWAKRRYKDVFLHQLTDATGSCEEVKVWLDFSRDCGYIEQGAHKKLFDSYNKIGAMLFGLITNWRKF